NSSSSIDDDNNNQEKYSSGWPASGKLAGQLITAVEEGVKNRKKTPGIFQIGNIDAVENKALLQERLETIIDAEIKLPNVGAAGNQGGRDEMEDSHVVCELTIGGKEAFFYGVFDGHGDEGNVAEYLKVNLPGLLASKWGNKELTELTDGDITNAIVESCFEMERAVVDIEGGSTATFVLQVGDGRLYTANVGDSRTVLMKKDDNFYQLSEDADPLNSRFAKRIEKMNHTVVQKGAMKGYVNGKVAVARDIGLSFLSPRPKITFIDRDVETDLTQGELGYSKGDYLVLACDGLWDVATNNEVYQAIWQMEEAGKNVRQMAGYLAFGAQMHKSRDNVTVVVVKL
ncbi:MAG: hypothetical protein K940chlam9_01668, partial [Chlamydiae bacterium]|nr:hypothetical protein [Chlamydiota bacterium]